MDSLFIHFDIIETRRSSMKITIKTGGWLRHHLPGAPADNQAEVEVAEGATPEGVIAQLALPTDDHYAVEINGTLVPRAEHGSRALAASDVLTILHVPKAGM
jgi:sulfur carrier protein ThiS